MWRKLFWVTVIALLTQVHAPCYAGSQKGLTQSNFSVEEAAHFAKQVEKTAARHGARVFILARLGSPKNQLPEGIHYTHVGLAVYSSIQTEDGATLRGYAIHNLYQDVNDLSRSQLVMDYPVDFFLGAVELKAGIIIPSQIVQQKILAAFEQGVNRQLHNPEYSIISNPYSRDYQNCTEHLLDLLFAAIYATDSLAQIKANQRAYFKAHSIEVSPFKRLLAPVFSSEIQMRDQGKSIKVATFTSIANFMTQYGLADKVLNLDKDTPGLDSISISRQ
jgi:hypothetical protein